MKVTARNTLLTLVFLIIVTGIVTGGTAWSQTVAADGPYFVVDPRIPVNQETKHVFSTIPHAITQLNNLRQQAWGATLILLPGAYPVAATITINIPYLKIVTRDGTDKVRLVALATIGNGKPMLNITARGVTVQDVKLIGNGVGAGIQGIAVAAPGVTVQDVLISNFSGTGLTANNSERLSIIGCSVINNGANGITLNACQGAIVNNCAITHNAVIGLQIGGSNNAQITGCKVSNNPGNGIRIATSSFVKITKNKEVNANLTGVSINTCGYCEISENTLVGNAAGINLTASVGCTVQENTCQNTGTGPAISLVNSEGNHITKNTLYGVDTPAPATATILLSGPTAQNTISENTITSNWWGIVLTQNKGGSPSGNEISNNKIANTSAAGIFISNTGGNNVIQKNSVSNSARFGIQIQAANSDRFDSNSIENSAADGIIINPPTPGAVTNCFVTNNLIANPGSNGIAIIAPPGAAPTVTLTLSHNMISKAAANGLNVNGLAGFSAEFNEFAANEGIGINIAGAANMVLWRNSVHNNEQVGLQVANLAGPAFVRQNFIYANQRGGVNYTSTAQPFVLESNSIFANLGYALSITGAPAVGTSFAKNWWGSITGPAGVLNGTGNAVLGLNNANLIAPILPAPPYMGLAGDTKPFLTVDEAQVAFIPTFTAGRVVVDRTDTAALKLVFTSVSVRNNALVATVPFSADALSSKVFTALGKIIAASCILVSGIQDGNVSVSFEYPAGLKAKSSQLSLYVYEGGNWQFNSGNWSLENGKWVPVSNCHLDNAHNIVGDIPVESLTGGVKAIALVEKQAQP